MAAKLSNIRVNEISLVDAPANKSAKVVLMKREEEDIDKREFSTEARRHAASSGAAEPDGSFPIENATDLHNAMRAIGRSKNPDKTRAHIRSRARALGLSGELSDSFKKEVPDRDWLNIELFKEISRSMENPETAGPAVTESTELKMLEGIIKALGLPAEAKDEEIVKAINDRNIALEIAKADMDEDEKSYHDSMEKEGDKKAFRDMDKAGRKDKMKKHEELPDWIKKKLDSAEAIEKRLAVLEERDAVAKFAKMAADFGLETSEASLIRKAYEGDHKSIDAILKMVADARVTAEKAGLFNEIGSAVNQTGFGDAYDELMVKAQAYRTLHPELTEAQAFEKVYTDPANVTLTKRERSENRPRAN